MKDLINIYESSVPQKIDPKAQAELKAIIAETNRDIREKGLKHWCFLALLVLGALGVIIVTIVKILHLILPEQYKWLNQEQISKIEEFLTSGVIGGSIVGIYKSKAAGSNKED
ncbi:MAG: hypothetical protein H7101_13715 [Deinococcales bacterium]|nr:hypothetical protein [Chitinophagaceae bacterium]